MTRVISLFVACFFTAMVFAQKNFTYTPEHPKAGDRITFTYEPAGVLGGNIKPVEAAFFLNGGDKLDADDIALTRVGRKFTGSVQTNPGNSLVWFTFSIDGQFDNNFNDGYYILLNDDDGMLKKGAYAQLGILYTGNLGVEHDYGKALSFMKKEMELHPADRNDYLLSYCRTLLRTDKQEGATAIHREIESLLGKGLNKEDDYKLVEDLYNLLDLRQHSNFFATLKREKFPAGNWTIAESIGKLSVEKDPVKAKQMADDLAGKLVSDPRYKSFQNSLDLIKASPLQAYRNNKDWEGFKNAWPLYKNLVSANFIAAKVVDELRDDPSKIFFVEQLSKDMTDFARREIATPTQTKIPRITTKAWESFRKSIFLSFANAYANVLYRKGDYKKAMQISKEVLATDSRNTAEYYSTFALIAAKIFPEKQYKRELEGLVKKGFGTTVISEGLKKIYVNEKGSEAGFTEYITALKKDSYMKMLEELRIKMLNNASPGFALLDLDGKKISITELKGKTVIVDFWATWCGPCKASFPVMQKMVTKYKDNPDVKFIFIDTWEKGEEKEKKAAEFLAENKYSFHVLMDNDDKVVAQFKVEGIPTKFVIDKAGTIRFKSIGFNNDEEKFIQELDAMISFASGKEPENAADKPF